jgi:hypothetical protein
MPAIDGVWILYAWDVTLPEPGWVEQRRAYELSPVLATGLRWRDEGQQVRFEWVAVEPPVPGPEDMKIGTRHDDGPPPLTWAIVTGTKVYE